LLTTWTFKTKPSTLSSKERKQARLNIQGFSQIKSVDSGETFAPTGKFTTLIMVLMYTIDLKIPIRQFDVKSAFLYTPLKEELYIKTPKGSNRKASFLQLHNSLYGLKKAPANCFKTLTTWFDERISPNLPLTPACISRKTRTHTSLQEKLLQLSSVDMQLL
jgi:hypothetical protein